MNGLGWGMACQLTVNILSRHNMNHLPQRHAALMVCFLFFFKAALLFWVVFYTVMTSVVCNIAFKNRAHSSQSQSVVSARSVSLFVVFVKHVAGKSHLPLPKHQAATFIHETKVADGALG